MTLRTAWLAFVCALGVTWVWKTIMEQQVRPLTSAEIVAFEFARTPAGATEWLSQWEESGLLTQARRSVYLDFIFLLLYPLPFYFACRAIALGNHPHVQVWARRFAHGVWWAGGFDAVENLGLLHTLLASPDAVVTGLTAFFALLKFGVLTVTFVFVVAAGLYYAYKRAVR